MKRLKLMTSDLLKTTNPTSDVSFVLDRLQRRPLHQELHQFGANPLGVAVPHRAGRVDHAGPGGWRRR